MIEAGHVEAGQREPGEPGRGQQVAAPEGGGHGALEAQQQRPHEGQLQEQRVAQREDQEARRLLQFMGSILRRAAAADHGSA